MRKYTIGIGALAIIAILVVVFGMRFDTPQSVSTSTESADASSTALQQSALRTPPAGYAVYNNVEYGFSLFYPDALTVAEHDMGGGALTVTFQNVQTAQGFQIFIVPYAEPQVTEQRFNEDEPSGVQQGLKSVTIDGATGASFYSTNVALGDTAEIWFIKGGYLYEVTTLKPLASWLSGIMQSWEFMH